MINYMLVILSRNTKKLKTNLKQYECEFLYYFQQVHDISNSTAQTKYTFIIVVELVKKIAYESKGK